MPDSSPLILEAKKLLRKNPRDGAHDLKHHQDVWKLCQEIVAHEELDLDVELLKVATFWHDVIVSSPKQHSKNNVIETADHLQRLMSDYGFESDQIVETTDAVRTHEFRDLPRSKLGRVLQDADKLDVLSEDRWQRTIQSYEDGEMSEEQLRSYMQTALKWAPILSATFHFQYSRDRAEASLQLLWEDEERRRVIFELGLQAEYERAHRRKDSLKTKILRTVIRLQNVFHSIKPLPFKSSKIK